MSWVRIALVGEFTFPAVVFVSTAACHLRKLRSAFTHALLAILSLYFLTPSLMCPMLMSLIACTNTVQLT